VSEPLTAEEQNAHLEVLRTPPGPDDYCVVCAELWPCRFALIATRKLADEGPADDGLRRASEVRGFGHCPCTCCRGRWEVVSTTLRCNGGCGCTAGPRIAPIPAGLEVSPERLP